MAFKLYTLLVLVAMAAAAYAYSSGAPTDVCGDMKPKHPYEPQTSAFPYKVSVDKATIKPTDKVKISISGGKPFKGYLVQVRDEAGAKAVGSFTVDKASGKAIACGSPNSAVTHSNDAVKSGVSLEWTPPAAAKGTFTVYTTVAEDGATFWVKQPTSKITVN